MLNLRILWLSPYAPYPPDTGGRQRVHHLLRASLEAGHRVDMFSIEMAPARYPNPLPHGLTVHHFGAAPRDNSSEKLVSLLARLPEIAHATRTPAVVAALRDLPPGTFDVAVLEHAHAGGLLREVRALGVPVVLDAHNVEWHVLRQAADQAPTRLRRARFLIDALKLRRLEGALRRQVQLTVAVSEDDATQLRAMRGPAPVVVEPNGVDPDAVRWRDHTEPRGAALLMTGHLGYVPNVDAALWAAREVIPAAIARVPGLTLTLAGREPSPEIAPALRQPGVVLRADPPDINECFAAADVFLAPLRMGSGTRIKVLEALAAGLVVVGTPAALAGLDVERRGLALCGRTPGELVDAVERALSDRQLRARVAAEGRAFVLQSHDWRAIGRSFEARLRALAAAPVP